MSSSILKTCDFCGLGWLADLLFPLNRFFALGVCLDHQRFDNNLRLFLLSRLLSEQRLSIDALPFQGPTNVRWLRALLPSFYVILPIDIEDLIDLRTKCRVFDRKTGLHAMEKVPGHPVRASEINLRIARVFETINPAVL